MIFVISFKVKKDFLCCNSNFTNRISINICKRKYKKVRLVEVCISLINKILNIGLNHKKMWVA